MKDLRYKIALTKIPLVGVVTAKTLVSYCGGVAQVFEASKGALKKIPGIGEQIADQVRSALALELADREIELLEQYDIQPLFYLDSNFPRRLKPLHDAPILLYYKGTADLNVLRVLSVVGTRQPTNHGVGFCEELIAALAPYQPLIVSGLAYGMDATAHRKSLECGLDTVAVLGHGLHRIYPATHRSLALKMTEQGGLLTEFTFDEGPEKEHFPMRNRIVAGLADALVVVETALRGGSIITVQQANGYGRNVFAVPGRPRDIYSQGCNMLIKKSWGHLLESADDIVRVLGWKSNGDPSELTRQQLLFDELTEMEKMIIDLIHDNEDIDIDKLSLFSKMGHSQLASLLLDLEFKGVVRSLPGKRFVLR